MSHVVMTSVARAPVSPNRGSRITSPHGGAGRSETTRRCEPRTTGSQRHTLRSVVMTSDHGSSATENGPVGAGRDPRPAPSAPDIITPPPFTVRVTTAADLRTALASAMPGTAIMLADGIYPGLFTITRSGTETDPIWLYGPRAAIIDAGGRSGYALHLDHCHDVRVVGFTVRNCQKGVMADGARHCTIATLDICNIGDEAIHLRTHSTDNLVTDNRIHGTGKRVRKYGEGVYVGSAVINWGRGRHPDRSDGNRIVGNDISGTTAEAIDVKEGTTGTTIVSNVMSADSLSAADSWIDVKGNDCTVTDNVGLPGGTLLDGIQVHVIKKGWGQRNTFQRNRLTVTAPGYGIYVKGGRRGNLGNVVGCDNIVVGAVKGLSNVPCSSR